MNRKWKNSLLNCETYNSDDKRQQKLQFEKIKIKVLYDKLQEDVNV